MFEAAVDQMFRKSNLTSQHKFLDIGCGIGSIVLQAAAWAGCQAAVSVSHAIRSFCVIWPAGRPRVLLCTVT